VVIFSLKSKISSIQELVKAIWTPLRSGLDKTLNWTLQGL